MDIQQALATFFWQGSVWPEDQTEEPEPYSGDPEAVTEDDCPQEELKEIKEMATIFDAEVAKLDLSGTVWEDSSQIAHDWVLTSFDHGTGFWDRYYDGPNAKLGDKLTKLAKLYPFPEISIQVDGGWLS